FPSQLLSLFWLRQRYWILKLGKPARLYKEDCQENNLSFDRKGLSVDRLRAPGKRENTLDSNLSSTDFVDFLFPSQLLSLFWLRQRYWILKLGKPARLYNYVNQGSI